MTRLITSRPQMLRFPIQILLQIGILTVSLASAAFCANNAEMGIERIARFVPIGYQSPQAASDETVQWVQIDLGKTYPIDAVKLMPVVGWGGEGIGFPIRFRVNVSDDPAFSASAVIVDNTSSDYGDPGDKIGVYHSQGITGRYVRLTVTRLRNRQFSLSKFEVWSDGKDVAQGASVLDSIGRNMGKTLLTRAPRPGGEEVVTDHPENVTPYSKWKPVPYQIQAPTSGVRLDDGLYSSVMKDNIAYLETSFSVDELLRPFRERAGLPVPAGLRQPVPFWDTDLPGSNAGRFLMGSGNTLRWIDDPELRDRANRVVDGIETCRDSNGYIMAYPPDTIFHSERAAYTRTWVTRGLVEAGYGVNPKAFDLLRGYYDWFDQCEYLPELLRRAGQGVQGMIGSTRMYFTPKGKPEDLQVVQRYFQENYWLDELAARDPKAIWRYPYDHPHNYLITSLEPYLDLYRATGQRHYLDAALGGWDLYHDDWEHVGGSIAICEGDVYEPKSYYLHRHTGELCGSVFWMRYNQRFHLLYPDQEKYVTEIEKSIYNVVLANQVGSKGLRYHANLVGKKDSSTPICTNSCCEGQGTSAIGSLPEYIYSLAKDGIYVDMFAGSTITYKQGGSTIKVHMATDFPFTPDVHLHVTTSHPVLSSIRIRVPSWATKDMTISVNGKPAISARPGSYAVLSRSWKDGDSITFKLPVGFRMTEYNGMEQNGHRRYALEYGPVLMALTGDVDDQGRAELAFNGDDFTKRLKPIDGQSLHFAIDGDPHHQYLPYWQVKDETFTCYPTIEAHGSHLAETVGADDLALASMGAVATSDSELSTEPGNTPKAIDGIIASPDDFSNRWHSSVDSTHPHWIQVKLAKPALIGRVVIRFADPQGHPTSFQGVVKAGGKDTVVFDVTGYADSRKFVAKFRPILTDTFRFVVRNSANPAYPNAAQISELEVYPPAAH